MFFDRTVIIGKDICVYRFGKIPFHDFINVNIRETCPHTREHIKSSSCGCAAFNQNAFFIFRCDVTARADTDKGASAVADRRLE